MKSLLLIVGVLLVIVQAPDLRHPCMGAIAAMVAQEQEPAPPGERRLPKGEWCQRPVEGMRKEAHACSCHAHDCTKNPDDQNNRSAHTDANCLVFCDVKNCACEKMDCP